jgi:hypothetical protein
MPSPNFDNRFATILLRNQRALVQRTEMTQQTRLSVLSIMGATAKRLSNMLISFRFAV